MNKYEMENRLVIRNQIFLKRSPLFALVLCIFISGCTFVDGVRSGFTLRIQPEPFSATYEIYHLTDRGETMFIQTNGVYILDLPCRSVGEGRLFGIFTVNKTPSDYVVVKQSGKVICRVTVASVSSSSVSTNGAHVFKVE